MKNIIAFILTFSIQFSLLTQLPISQIEGYLEVYLPNDTTSTYIGKSVGRKVNSTTNLRNTFVGSNNGVLNTSGSENSFFGTGSGYFNTIGEANSFFGNGAGYLNTTGKSNSFFGQMSGVTNSYGDSNSFFGRHSGASNTHGSENSFFGYISGSSTTSGYYNSFFGSNSGKSNSIGEGNSFFGYNSGERNISGIYNTFFGASAGDQITKGDRNICIGFQSGPDILDSLTSKRLYIDIMNTSNPLIYGDFDTDLVGIHGRLGVGTKTITKGKLQVEGSVNFDLAEKAYYFVNLATDMADFGHSGPGGYSDYSIYACHGVAAHVFHALSDQRIKKDIIPSDNKTDLNTLMQIEVDDYSHIDQVKNGPNKRKGMIAQQIESVFPEAIGKSTEIVPSIYCLSTSIQKSGNEWVINLSKAHDLKKGDIVRLITRDMEEKEVLVSSVLNVDSFSIEAWSGKIPEDLFIYGKQVADFRTIDYDRIFILGVSAIQELHKENEDLKNNQTSLKDRLDKIERLLNSFVRLDKK